MLQMGPAFGKDPLIRVNKRNAIEWLVVGKSPSSHPSLTLPDVTCCCFAMNAW